jgi:hypothetical protein
VENFARLLAGVRVVPRAHERLAERQRRLQLGKGLRYQRRVQAVAGKQTREARETSYVEMRQRRRQLFVPRQPCHQLGAGGGAQARRVLIRGRGPIH